MQPTLKMNLYIFTNALYALKKKKRSETAVASLGSPSGAVFGVFNRMVANTVCVFSCACIGWVAVTPQFKDTLTLRGYTPQGTVLALYNLQEKKTKTKTNSCVKLTCSH